MTSLEKRNKIKEVIKEENQIGGGLTAEMRHNFNILIDYFISEEGLDSIISSIRESEINTILDEN